MYSFRVALQLQTSSSGKQSLGCVGIQRKFVTYCKQDRFQSGTKVVEVEWVATLAGAEEVKQHLFDDMIEPRNCVY